MSLDSLLHFISSSSAAPESEADLAFAEIDQSGRITSINPFGKLAWGWRIGTQLPAEIQLTLEGLRTDESTELPLTEGGLHLRGVRRGDGGFFLIGNEPSASASQGDQLSFRTLMDQIGHPALCVNPTGHAWYVNPAAAGILNQDAASLTGRPVLAEILHPEDRWKVAEILELAARDGSAQVSVRFGSTARTGVLHLVRSAKDEFQAVILPLNDTAGSPWQADTFYQSFLEQGPVAIVYIDQTGRVTFENHGFRDIVGSAAEDSWIGQQLSEVPALPSDHAADILATMSTGKAFAGELTLLDARTGESSLIVYVHAAPIMRPDGTCQGAALMLEDRTIAVRSTRELEQIERMNTLSGALRTAATETTSPAQFRENGLKQLASGVGADQAILLGLSIRRDRLVEMTRWTRSDDPSRDFSEENQIDLPRSTGSCNGFLPGDHALRTELDSLGDAAEWWMAPVHDNGQYAGCLAIGWRMGRRDGRFASPERLQTLAELFDRLYSGLQTTARYQKTVAAIDDALFGFSYLPDRSRRYHFATDAMEHLAGVSPDDLVAFESRGMSWSRDVVHPEDASLVRAHDRALEDGHESRVTYRVRHTDGTIRWLQERATPRADSTGATAVNGILTDVSEQKEAELVLMQAKKEAEASDAAKTAFIATLSHEIRTPLGAVNGFSKLLEREIEEFEEELPQDLPEQVHEFVQAIGERSQRLLHLVGDLFELSNLELGKATLHTRSSELCALVRDLVEPHRDGIEEKGLDLLISQRTPSLNVEVDRRQFKRVMDNLLSNAIKFTEHGQIQVECSRRGDTAVIEVRDTGIGISEAYQERLFDPFSQEEDWKNRRFEGTGLGLALVRRLMEMMQGDVEVESEKDHGSTFRLILPLSQEADGPESISADRSAAPRQSAPRPTAPVVPLRNNQDEPDSGSIPGQDQDSGMTLRWIEPRSDS